MFLGLETGRPSNYNMPGQNPTRRAGMRRAGALLLACYIAYLAALVRGYS
jgi:hypothetical protein